MKYMVIAIVALALAGAAFAANNGNGTSDTPASQCGSVHGAFADDNGNFGFLGEDGGTPGYHNGAVGQQPGATGYNNSHTSCQSQS